MSIVTSIQALFPSPSTEVSLAKGIPMSMLEMVRIAYKDAGIEVRVKYRGPRKAQAGISMPCIGISAGPGRTYIRSKRTARSTCLKAYATSFAVYPL